MCMLSCIKDIIQKLEVYSCN